MNVAAPEHKSTIRWKDLREWLDTADAMGLVAHVDEADWNLEVAVLTELAFRQTQRRPALLFDRIKGYPPGYRVLTNPIGSPEKFALTWGLPQGLPKMEVVDAIRHRLVSIDPIPPRTVDDGPLFENQIAGDAVDVLKFPAPLWHEADGGRYIGTGNLVITRDADDGWVNAATYRVMVHDRNTVGIFLAPNGHLISHLNKYHSRGQPCPVVICVGHDPLLFVAAVSNISRRVSEYDWVGGVRGEPIEVVGGGETGLPIPARAEIALEGEILPELREEGPYGEFTGYYSSTSRPQPIARITTIYHRNDPIILGTPPLRPPSDTSYVPLYTRPALIWNALEATGLAGVKGVWAHGGVGLIIALAIEQRYPGHAKQAAFLASQLPGTAHMMRFVIVVDDDVDVSDIDHVLWAVSTRCDPDRDIDLLRRCASSPLDPALSPAPEAAFNSRMVIDATRPYERLKNFPKVIAMPPQVREEVMRRYGDLLARW